VKNFAFYQCKYSLSCRGLGKGKLFWFFSVGALALEKPNVLDRALAFSAWHTTFPRLAEGGFLT
jgi:hypothetical protein